MTHLFLTKKYMRNLVSLLNKMTVNLPDDRFLFHGAGGEIKPAGSFLLSLLLE